MDTATTETDRPKDAIDPPADVPGAEPSGPPRLRRSRRRRMLAGVAGGVANRFDVDVSLVRVAFVVLAFAWGLGVVVYLAMWALVPKEPADALAGDLDAPDGEPTSPWLSYLLLAAVLAFGLLVLSSWWGGPRWGGAVGLLWLVLLVGLLVVAIGGSKGATLRRVVAVLLLGAISLAMLFVGAFLALVAWTGVPITGGIGERVYAPASLAQVQRTYRLAAGNLTVDLRRVHFVGHTPRHVTASVAVGLVTVEVPPGVVVDVSAHSGVGNVVATPSSVARFGTPTGASKGHAPQLVLDVEAGVGEVRLIRAPAT